MISQKKGFIFCYNSKQIELITCKINYKVIPYYKTSNKKKLYKLIENYSKTISLGDDKTKNKIFKKLTNLSQDEYYRYCLIDQIQQYKDMKNDIGKMTKESLVEENIKKEDFLIKINFDQIFFSNIYNPLRLSKKRKSKEFGNIKYFGLLNLKYYSTNTLLPLRKSYYSFFSESVDTVIINEDLYKIKFKSLNNAEKTYITSAQINKDHSNYKTLQVISSPFAKRPESKKSIKSILTRIKENTFGKFGSLVQQLLKDLLKESTVDSQKKEIQIVGNKTDKIKNDILIDIPRKKIIVINFIKQLGLEKFFSDNLDTNLMLEAIRMSDLGYQKKFKDYTIEAINKALIKIESNILSQPEEKRFLSLQEMNNLDSLKFIVELITDDHLLEVKEEEFDSEEYLALMDKNPIKP